MLDPSPFRSVHDPAHQILLPFTQCKNLDFIIPVKEIIHRNTQIQPNLHNYSLRLFQADSTLHYVDNENLPHKHHALSSLKIRSKQVWALCLKCTISSATGTYFPHFEGEVSKERQQSTTQGQEIPGSYRTTYNSHYTE